MDISINVPKTSEINISGNTKEIRVPDKSVTYAKLADDVTLILSEKADKASTDSALEQKADKDSVDAEISGVNVALERIKYYGSADVVPSDESWFTVNSTGETITGLTDTGKTQTELVIPYEINGVEITTLFGSTNSISGLPQSILDGSSVTKVVIPKSVTILGEIAFYECSSLNSINIPNSITSIGPCAFSYCSSLTSINISNNVTSIGYEAFSGCTNLTIYCEQGSTADDYARNNNIPVVYTDITDEPTFRSMTVNGDINFINSNRVGMNGVYMVDYEVTAVDTSIPKEHHLTHKADTAEVLTKTNTTAFAPTADYQPATKKYVDDAISAAISAYDTEAMALLGGDAE